MSKLFDSNWEETKKALIAGIPPNQNRKMMETQLGPCQIPKPKFKFDPEDCYE